jgi:hypothetical protein
MWELDSDFPLPVLAFLSLILARLWLREGRGLSLSLNLTAWGDKPPSSALSPGIGSGLQLPCHFSHAHRGRKAFSHLGVPEQGH